MASAAEGMGSGAGNDAGGGAGNARKAQLHNNLLRA